MFLVNKTTLGYLIACIQHNVGDYLYARDVLLICVGLLVIMIYRDRLQLKFVQQRQHQLLQPVQMRSQFSHSSTALQFVIVYIYFRQFLVHEFVHVCKAKNYIRRIYVVITVHSYFIVLQTYISRSRYHPGETRDLLQEEHIRVRGRISQGHLYGVPVAL